MVADADLRVRDLHAPVRGVHEVLRGERDVVGDLAQVDRAVGRSRVVGQAVTTGAGRNADRRNTGVVDVVGRDLLAKGRHVGLGSGVLSLLALVQEHRDGDRGKDADDDHDDEKLDEGEATLTLLLRLTNASEHCRPFETIRVEPRSFVLFLCAAPPERCRLRQLG